MKNLTELKSNWSEIKEKLKQKFVMLTERDVLFLEGKEDEMIARLQFRLSKTKEEVNQLLSEL